MLFYFSGLLIRPGRTLERILRQRPGFVRIVLFLTVVGLLRGLLDGAWVLINDQQFLALWSEGRLWGWYLTKGYPLLLADWIAAYVRWLGFALVPYAVGRFFAGRGRLVDFLRVYGVAMGIYVVTVLLNAAYFFAPLPTITFRAASGFGPRWGVGQMVTSLWLVYISYRVVRRLHGLPVFESLLTGVLVPALNLAALIGLGALFYRLPAVASLPVRQFEAAGLLAFGAGGLGLVALFIAVAVWLARRERRKVEGGKR